MTQVGLFGGEVANVAPSAWWCNCGALVRGRRCPNCARPPGKADRARPRLETPPTLPLPLPQAPTRQRRPRLADDPTLRGEYSFEGATRRCVIRLFRTGSTCSVDVLSPDGKRCLQGFDDRTFSGALRQARAEGVRYDAEEATKIVRSLSRP